MTAWIGPSDVRPSLALCWGLAFAYGVVAAGLIQLVLLPYVFPAWHGGDGLLAGGDWLVFHRYGEYLARLIQARGWAAFELRPFGLAPAGIAGAVYALTVPRPWTLIPLNAALHATATILLLRVVELFLPVRRRALWTVLPYLLYPTALTWVAQIHKDSLFALGYAALLFGWAALAAAARRAGRGAGGALAALGVGFVLIWVVRPEHVWPMQGLGLVPAVIALGAWVGVAARESGLRLRAAAVIGLLAAVMVLPSWFDRATAVRTLPGRPPARATAPDELRDGRWTDPVAQRGVRALAWYRTDWLPPSVDRAAYRLALIREQFLIEYLAGQSNIDVDVGMRSAGDLLRRLPRGLQVALFAPFPLRWLDAGSQAWTSTSRRIVSLEMVGVYVAMLGLPLAMWRWGRRPELWIVVLACVLPLALYGVTIPNVGALHRFRYPFLMPLVALGLAAWLRGWRRPASS